MLVRICTFAGACLLAVPASAQEERPTGYPRSANERSASALTFSGVYTAEVRANVSGGLRRGGRYVDNLDLQLAVDADKLVGWKGARFFAYVIRNNGVAFSPVLSGDLQGVSNIETGTKATKLFEAWGEQAIGNTASVKAGLYYLNSEFDTTISGGLFLLSAHGIGPDIAQLGRNGPSIFPATALTIRGEWTPTDRMLLRIAVLDGKPDDPVRPAAIAARPAPEKGALLIGEANYLTRRSKMAIGAWHYTERMVPMTNGEIGHGNAGGYAFVEHQLSGQEVRGGPGVTGWLRVGLANPRYNPVARYLGGGIVRNGTLPRRPVDQAGVSIAVADLGRAYRRITSAGRREVVLEASYRLVLSRWLSVQPDMQIVLSPGGRRDLSPAIIPVLRVKIGR